MRLLGIDIGGTKTAVCVGDETGRILHSHRISSRSATIRTYVDTLLAACRAGLDAAGTAPDDIDAVGISAPGPLDVKRGVLIAPPNNPGWTDVPVVEIVRGALGRPVYFNNDANACALAEMSFGGHGVRDLIYLTCSTGMGGGIIANGGLVQGITDTGGEVGHQVLDIHGPPCGCGQRGCFEAFVGGKNVMDRMREKIRSERIRTSIVDRVGGRLEDIDFRAFAEAAKEGDPFAVGEWEQYTDRFAQGLGNLIMILNPELIVLGTIAIHQGDFLLGPVREKVKRFAWPWPLHACRIMPSGLGPQIGDLAAIAVAALGLREAAAAGEERAGLPG